MQKKKQKFFKIPKFQKFKKTKNSKKIQNSKNSKDSKNSKNEENDVCKYIMKNDENVVVVIRQAPVAPNWTRIGVPYIVFREESDGGTPGV